ncbi:MAG: ribonuclease Y, partial [Lentisphaerae bacterium]|nr:ribonuclease Y [Lentisphaerota bacterium]
MNTTVAIAMSMGTLGVGYAARYLIGRYLAGSLESQARSQLEEARREGQGIRKEGEIQAKAEVLKAREEFEKSVKARREELNRIEARIMERESNLDRKVAMIEKKEHGLDEKLAGVKEKSEALDRAREEAERVAGEERNRLQRVAGMTQDEARQTLLQRMEEQVHGEIGNLLRRLQEEAKETAEREARNIVATAIERYSGSHASEMMTSTVALPGDDMKGRIIGRDGRNIRALESLCGVNILIDDTPEAVVISGFDPIRREVARQTLELLISDGRIHPARIEEVVGSVQESIEETIRKAGEEAAYGIGLQGAAPELLRRLGRLKFRTSYSQNVLQHSIEVASLMGVMAGELNLDVALAKRIGLFHDVGKALDHEVEGGHALIGADLLKRHGEPQVVINAVAAHHEEVPSESLYACLASAADSISSSRTGARRETTEIYVKRLEKLEEIANSFEGIER